jgi:hypothetical protein
MTATLRALLVDGKLGPLTLGMSGVEVERLLGTPDNISPQKYPRILTYGSLQVALRDERVVFLGVYFRSGEGELPPAVAFTGFVPSRLTTVAAFQSYLRDERINCQTHERVTLGHQIGLVSPARVSILFVRGGIELDSLQLGR